MSFGAAISGLQSSEKWLNVISNNVANSETVGFKSSQLNFADLISQDLSAASGDNASNNLGGINAEQVGLGVTVGSIATDISQGSIETTGQVTDIAIQGQGYLTVKTGNTTSYTRAGNLTFDSAGDLVTAAGGLVQGWSLERTTTAAGAVMVTVNQALNTTNDSAIGNIVVPNNLELAPQATSDNVNQTGNQNLGVVLSGNLDNNTPINAGAPPVTGTAAGLAAMEAQANATTSFTAYDSLGTAHTFTMYWFQTANTPAAPASWSYYMFDTSNGAQPTAGAAAGTPGAFIASNTANGTGTTTSTLAVTFNPDGSLASNGTVEGAAATNVVITVPYANGSIAPMTFSLDLGTPNTVNGGVTTFGLRDGMTGDYGNGTVNATTGVYTPVQTVYWKGSDGFSEGTLTGLAFGNTGQVNATFSNGKTIAVAQLALTNFTNPGGLENIGGNYFMPSANSGSQQIGTAGANGFGSIAGGALEQSNVDLTVELTNMIVAQKMFESNSKVITTQASILETLIQAVPAQ